nr:hypothetical protein HK105_002097 [Polyrhizophydium stewartii]
MTKAFYILIFDVKTGLLTKIKYAHFPIIQAVTVGIPVALLVATSIVAPIRSVSVYAENIDGYRHTCATSSTGQSLHIAVFAWHAAQAAAVLGFQLIGAVIPDAYNTTRQTSVSVLIIAAVYIIYASQSPSQTAATTQFYVETGTIAFGGLLCWMTLLGWSLFQAHVHAKQLTKHGFSEKSKTRQNSQKRFNPRTGSRAATCADTVKEDGNSAHPMGIILSLGRPQKRSYEESRYEKRARPRPKPEFDVVAEARTREVALKLKEHSHHWIIKGAHAERNGELRVVQMLKSGRREWTHQRRCSTLACCRSGVPLCSPCCRRPCACCASGSGTRAM